MSQIHGSSNVIQINPSFKLSSNNSNYNSPQQKRDHIPPIRGIAVSKKWLAVSCDQQKIRIYDIERDFELIKILDGRKAGVDGVPIANLHAIIFAGFKTVEEQQSSSSSSSSSAAASASSSQQQQQQQQYETLPEFLIAPSTKQVNELVLYRTPVFLSSSSTSSDSAQQQQEEGEKEEQHHQHPWQQLGKFCGLQAQIQMVVENPLREEIAAIAFSYGMIWKIRTQEVIAKFQNTDSFYSISYSNADYTELVGGCFSGKHISFWRLTRDIKTAEEEDNADDDDNAYGYNWRNVQDENIKCVKRLKVNVSHDGPGKVVCDPQNFSFFLVTNNNSDEPIRCFDSVTKKEQFTISKYGGQRYIYVLSISPNAQTIFIGCQTAGIFFEVSSGKQVGEIVYISRHEAGSENGITKEMEILLKEDGDKTTAFKCLHGKTCSCWCASWSSDSDIVYCGFDQGYCVAVENPLGMARWRRRKVVCLLRSIAEEGETSSCSEKKEKEEERTKMESAMAIYRVAQITSSFIPTFF